MTDEIQDDPFERNEDVVDVTDEDAERAPQPGNTPAPGEPPQEPGASTGYEDAADDDD